MMRSLCGVGFLCFLIAAASLAEEPKPGLYKSGGNYEVEVFRDLAYYDAPDADAKKHKLDLYAPKGQKGFPVMLFVHGGAWHSGDKKYWFDIYGNLARTFARNGVGTVVINYRLSPQVQHPGHVQDVARAFAWTVANISRYGGRVDQVFVSGHSAGGHLAALLATDESYLRAHGLTTRAIRGVMPLSGVYTIPPGKIFASVFTDKDDVREAASPTHHVRGGHPPFCILYAESDFPTCDAMSEHLCRELRACQCEAQVHKVKNRDHMSIIVRLVNEDDPATQMILDFIARHSDLKLTVKGGEKLTQQGK